MNTIRHLTHEQVTALCRAFPEKIGKGEQVPKEIQRLCFDARCQLSDAGLLLPYIREQSSVSNDAACTIVTGGTLIYACEMEGEKRAAVLLGRKQSWLIAIWDARTGAVQELPQVGDPVELLFSYDKNLAKRRREEAISWVVAKMEIMWQTRRQTRREGIVRALLSKLSRLVRL